MRYVKRPLKRNLFLSDYNIKKMKYFLTFFLCTCCAFSLKAQKDFKVFEKVIKDLSIPKSKIDTDLYNERILPYDNNTMVMVFPIKNGTEDDGWLDVYIVLFNIKEQKISCFYKGLSEWVSDAFVINGIAIDTAKFILSEGERAFGIRVFTHNQSRPNPAGEEYFSLFLPKGKTLKKVLDNYILSASRGDFNYCEGYEYIFDSMFIMETEKTNGYFNIKNRVTFTTRVSDSDCKDEISEKRIEIKYLKYNGKEYEGEEIKLD